MSVDYDKSELIRTKLQNMREIYQNFVCLMEMSMSSMRCDNIGIMRHPSSNGFDSYNNLNNFNAKTIIKDINRITHV